MLVLLADLKGLLKDVLVADHAHVWILLLRVCLLNDLSLVHSHLLHDVGE